MALSLSDHFNFKYLILLSLLIIVLSMVDIHRRSTHLVKKPFNEVKISLILNAGQFALLCLMVPLPNALTFR